MNQSDIADGGGRQCTCVALTFLCLSSSPQDMGDLHRSHVIDRILRDGTDLYKLCVPGLSPRSLLASELPPAAHIRGIAYNCPQSSSLLGRIDLEHSVEESLSLDDALTRAFSHCSYCLFTIANSEGQTGYTIGVVKQNDKILSFDSHSCDHQGLRSGIGTAIVMEASTVADFVLYTRELSKSLYGNTEGVLFEAVPVDCQKQISENAEPDQVNETVIESSLQEQLPRTSSSQRTVIKSADNSSISTANISGIGTCDKHPNVARLFYDKKRTMQNASIERWLKIHHFKIHLFKIHLFKNLSLLSIES